MHFNDTVECSCFPFRVWQDIAKKNNIFSNLLKTLITNFTHSTSVYHFNYLSMLNVILKIHYSLCLNFFSHLLARKPNLENFSINSNKFFHNVHLSESSFTCPGFRGSGLAWRLHNPMKARIFRNFHLSESRFTCSGLRASGLMWRLHNQMKARTEKHL